MGTLEWVGVPGGEVRLVRRESYLSTKQGGTNKKNWHIHFFGTVNPKL